MRRPANEMRRFANTPPLAAACALAACLLAACLLAACAGPPSGDSARSNNSASANNPGPASGAGQAGLPPVTSAHGGGATTAPPAAGGPASAKPDVDTKELDAKIERAEAKAKAAGASDADKRAAAEAYVERGNVYRDAGQPVLYKFALGDYRRALRYDPANAEAKAKADEIVSIYQSMGRPVPTNGLEP
jgi:hypothetical protein